MQCSQAAVLQLCVGNCSRRLLPAGALQAGRRALAHPDISTAAVMPFTQPRLFLRFQRDSAGCISLSLLLQFISLQTSALRLVRTPTQQLLLGLSAAMHVACMANASQAGFLQQRNAWVVVAVKPHLHPLWQLPLLAN